MRGHAPTQPSSSCPPSVHGRWGQPCTASSRSGHTQPCALAAAFQPGRHRRKVVDRRALLAANAADDSPAGGGDDGSDHWLALLHLGQAGRVAAGRDAPVEKGR